MWTEQNSKVSKMRKGRKKAKPTNEKLLMKDNNATDILKKKIFT